MISAELASDPLPPQPPRKKSVMHVRVVNARLRMAEVGAYRYRRHARQRTHAHTATGHYPASLREILKPKRPFQRCRSIDDNLMSPNDMKKRPLQRCPSGHTIGIDKT